MKSDLAKLSLALLSAVFVLGCQDLGSGPVGPDGPQFDKPDPDGECPVPRDAKDHCHGDEEPPPPPEDATFTANFTGNVVTIVGGPLFGPHGGKKMLSGGGVGRPEIKLNFTDFLHVVEGGESCFPVVPDVVGYPGILAIFQKTPGSDEAIIHYNFTGKDKVSGDTDIVYALLLRGVLDPADWVPATTEDEDMATIAGGTFEIAPEHGPGAISCKGTGDVDFTVEVVLNPA